MEEKFFALIEKMYTEFVDFRKEMTDFKREITGKVDRLEGKVDKNTLLLEQMQSKLEVVVEVQQNHMEANERQHAEIIDYINEETGVLKLAVKHLSDKVDFAAKQNQNEDELTATIAEDIVRYR